MATEKIQMDAVDQEEDFQHFRDYLTRIFRKYGPDVLTDAFTELVIEGSQQASGARREARCSFCGKRASEVADRIIQGAGVYIGIRCIDVCHNVRIQWSDQKSETTTETVGLNTALEPTAVPLSDEHRRRVRRNREMVMETRSLSRGTS